MRRNLKDIAPDHLTYLLSYALHRGDEPFPGKLQAIPRVTGAFPPGAAITGGYLAEGDGVKQSEYRAETLVEFLLGATEKDGVSHIYKDVLAALHESVDLHVDGDDVHLLPGLTGRCFSTSW